VRILHVIPRWIGGGPERHLLEVARHDRERPVLVQRRVLVLDRPLSAPLLVRARRLGVAVVAQPWQEVIEQEVAAADLVEITYWNHPALLELLRRPLPAARVVIRAAIAGHTLPQVLFPELVPFADAWVLSAPPGHGAQEVGLRHPLAVHIPALADMARLDGHLPRAHRGVRAVYLGGLSRSKLHPEYPHIVAAVSAPEVTFDLFGDADGATVEDLRERLRRLGALERVRIHGHVEDLAEAFAEADIFAYPLTPGSYVTSEKALQEAMWVGIPPVLLAGTAAAGWVEPGVTGFVARDIDTFVAHVERLARDAALRHRIGANARNFARTHFDPRRNAARLWAVVDHAMGVAKRTRLPLTGAESPPSQMFWQSLGDLADQFERRVAQVDAPGSPGDYLLLRGEGGLLHYRKAYPHDTPLRHWAEVLLASEARERAPHPPPPLH
jgi:glycosyltransferase involved in cell wall biosynthesis